MVADIRQRTAVLFIAVMLWHVILISSQVNSRAGVPLLEVITFGVFAEVQRGAGGLTGSIRNAWSGYVNLRRVRAENELLKRQLDELLGFQHQIGVKTIPTTVIGAGASPDSRTVTIDRGTSAGVRKDMAVIAPAGVVGRVVTVSRDAAKVQLL